MTVPKPPSYNEPVVFTNVSNELPRLPAEERLRVGNHIYALQAEVDIDDLLKIVNGKVVTTFLVHYLHIYCDVLKSTSVDAKGVLELKFQGQFAQQLRSIHIYARDFMSSVPAFKTLRIVSDKPATLYLYHESGPAAYWVEGVFGTTTVTKKPFHILKARTVCPYNGPPKCIGIDETFGYNDAGLSWRVEKTGCTLRHISAVPAGEVANFTFNDFKTMGPDFRRLRNLPRLLENIYTLAGTALMKQTPDTKTIASQLRFIITCTRNRPSLAELSIQPRELLSRIELPLGFIGSTALPSNATFVPNFTPEWYTKQLDQQVKYMSTLERSIEKSETNMAFAKQIESAAGKILTGVGLAVHDYTDLPSLLKTATDAMVDIQSKKQAMEDMKKDSEDARTKFTKGIEEYKKKMNDQLMFSIFTSIIECAVDIMATFATGGLAGGKAAASAGKAVKAVKEGVEAGKSIFDKIKSMIDMLKEVLPRLVSALNNQEAFDIKIRFVEMDKGFEAGGARTELQEKLAKAGRDVLAGTLSEAAGERIDYLGLLGGWKEFDIRVDSSFAQMQRDIGTESINGMEDFRMMLKMLAVRGQTYLAAMQEAYNARTKYLRACAESQERSKSEADIKQMAVATQVTDSKATDPKAWPMLKWVTSRELDHMKRTTFNTLHNCVLSLAYSSGNIASRHDHFEVVRPDMAVGQLDEKTSGDQAGKQVDTFAYQNHLIAQVNPIPSSQHQTIDASPDANRDHIFGNDWKTHLTNELKVPFTIPTTARGLESYHNMRMRTISADFVGLKRKDGTTAGIEKLDYIITLGPLMQDKVLTSAHGEPAHFSNLLFWMPAAPINKKGKQNNLTGKNYAQRAFCSNGWISIPKSTIADDHWDFSKVENIVLEVTGDAANM